ncbi:MAG: UDP-N-acetylmuramate--L-alanine ligase [Chitinophagaceae bacterium]
MELQNIHSVYFVGIGGIGMSAIARYFKQKNCDVSGYDKTETPLTLSLQAEGINIHYTEDLNQIPKQVDVVVYTPAIPASHQELVWYQQNGYQVVKRSDILHLITMSMEAICVAGTHGKTTVSTMIAHILRHSGVGCNAFLGGISSNYGVNHWGSTNHCAVIEADEYDRSFLKLNPFMSVLTAMDADHLDIYGTEEEMVRCYIEYLENIQDTLVYKHGLKNIRTLAIPHKYSYSLQNDSADFYAANIQITHGSYTFDFCHSEKVLGSVTLQVGGMHNVENAVAAIAIAYLYQVNIDSIAAAMKAYSGVKRRFEYIIKTDENIYIDDYAHHPEELKALLSSAKSLFPNQKLSVVFQPHLYTRTRDLAQGFADALDLADEVILLPIYPARELPIEGVSSEMILEKMANPNKHILSKDGVMQWVQASKPKVLITAGAGDIDQLIEPIKKSLML